MKIKAIQLLGLLLLMQSIQVFASDDTQRINRALQALDNLKAEFKQTLLDDEKNILQQSRGQVMLQRPDKFSWKYQDPYEQFIIADGKELWVYDVDLSQATVKPLETGVSNAPLLVLMKNEKIETQYQVNAIGQRKFLYWVELIPFAKDSEYQRIYLGLKDDEIKAMELRDAFGQSTQIVFENPQYNRIFNPDEFKFIPPAGVDVFGVGG